MHRRTASVPALRKLKHHTMRQSVQYAPEEWPGQPLEQRELHTLAYQCECGLAFTHTVKREDLPHGVD